MHKQKRPVLQHDNSDIDYVDSQSDRVGDDPPNGVSQPHFEGSVRLPFTFPKMGLGSPLGLPKT
jgi:hypothetical protein